ncbi:MAG: hypothetical protein RO469_15850 [Thermincola sp.]|jgi:hypothetical protein|nr:hypothetical protein [Thermincola sp.]MDT3704319.1 hypothetical protein [Thermincola sp.]
MKKYPIAVLMVILLFLSFNPIRGYFIWKNTMRTIEGSSIKNITYWGEAGQRRVLLNNDIKIFISELSRSGFYEYHRKPVGPTPNEGVIITFDDGRKILVNRWSEDVFEVNGFAGSQILIKNVQLGRIYENKM